MSMRASEITRRLPLGLDWARVTGRGALAMSLAAAMGALLLVILVRNLLSHQPLYDELLHILAARGLNATGEPVIGGGLYERAELFTHLVAFWFRHFGDSLVAARIPAWLSAIGLVALTGAWLTRRCGFLAGSSAALLLAIVSWTHDLAVFARFYTLHALVIMGMFIALYEAFARERRPEVRGLFLIAAAVCAALGWHLQITTLIAIFAALTGVIALLAFDYWKPISLLMMRHAVLTCLAILTVLLAAAWMVDALGLIERLATVPLWAKQHENSPEYYNAVLVREMPLLWPLTPFAFIAALRLDRRLAIFCAVTVLVTLFAHSIAAQKAARYIYYILPLLCIAWGCAISLCTRVLASFARQYLPALGRLSGVLALLAIALTILNSTEGRRAARLAAGRDGPEVLSYAQEADWSKAGPAVEEELRIAEKTVVSNSMKALYVYGDYDFELNASIVPETDTGAEFGLDTRTGRRAISSAESLAQVLGESSRTLVVVELEKLGNPVGVTRAAADILDSRCARLEVNPQSGLAAWSCRPPARTATQSQPLANR